MNSSTRLQSLILEAQTNPFAFHKAARHAYAVYSARYRKESKRLNTRALSVSEFYENWQDILVPQLHTLAEASNSTRLIKDIENYFSLNASGAQTRIEFLAETRAKELKKEFVIDQYLDGSFRARRTAARFVERDSAFNIELIERYHTYSLYRAAAIETSSTIYDTHRSALVRFGQFLRERSELRRIIRRTKKELSNARQEMSRLELKNTGLIASLFALHIDLIAIRSAYVNYEKAIEKLSASQRNSPAKRLALYEKETATLRAEHLNKLTGVQNLNDIQQGAKEIDTVLIQVFDLSNREYNQLMADLKRYRELQRETKRLQTLLDKA
jgi:hypothetical protein